MTRERELWEESVKGKNKSSTVTRSRRGRDEEIRVGVGTAEKETQIKKTSAREVKHTEEKNAQKEKHLSLE